MTKFIPYKKLSKKKKRELNAARRSTWTVNPVTRKPANPKAYNRKTARNWKDDSNSVPFPGSGQNDTSDRTDMEQKNRHRALPVGPGLHGRLNSPAACAPCAQEADMIPEQVDTAG